MELSEKEGMQLVRIARQAIESVFSSKQVEIPLELGKILAEKRGVFVTLKKRGELRGCIGFPEQTFALGSALIQAARSAAFEDPRFPPLEKDEMEKIEIEVSILTEPKEIKCKKEDLPKKIKIGKDGLIIRKGNFSGLLLPQVAEEWNLSAEEFLEAVSEKAGLPKDAWRDKNAKLFRFQANIFGENP